MRNENDLCQDSYNEASIIKTVLNHDLEIEDSFNLEKLRKTTLTTCTCLFTSSYGLPCRHMLWIYRQKQFEHIPTSVIAPVWLIAANIQVENQVLGHNIDSNIRECCVSALSTDEKYLIMCSEFKSIAEKAKNSEENIKLVRDTIQKLAANLQCMNQKEQNLAK